MTTFVADYTHEGRQFSIRFFAYDFCDAEHRVQSIRAGAELTGQVVAEGEA